MPDKLIIASSLKKTIEYIEKATINYPHIDNILKNKILDKCYNLLELVYRANVTKNIDCMKEIIVQIRVLEYFIKKA